MKSVLKTVLFVTFGLLLGSCGRSTKEVPQHSVFLTQPQKLNEQVIKTYPGMVKANHEISLGFKTAGQLEHFYVKEGDYVSKGQLLAVLDDADYKLGVEALQVQYNQVKGEVERTTKLFEQKSVSANDYEKATAGLKQLEVQLQVNKNKLAYTKLYAPCDGYIQSVNFSPAEMVDAGTPVFAMLDISSMEVIVDIPVSEYQQRKNFVRYGCRVPGIEGECDMKLLSLTPKADGNQLYQLRTTFVKRPDKNLTSGMNVTIDLTVLDTTYSNGYSLPLSAIFEDPDGQACVWIYGQDSTLSKRTIVCDGFDNQGRAVVIKGLRGDEQIVRAGVTMVREGEKVNVIEAMSTTNVGGLL